MDSEILYQQAEDMEQQARDKRAQADDLRSQASDLESEAKDLEVTAGVRRSEAASAAQDETLAERMSSPRHPLI